MDLYGYAALKGATTAVELKLSRWTRAFEQALIYLPATTFSYSLRSLSVRRRGWKFLC